MITVFSTVLSHWQNKIAGYLTISSELLTYFESKHISADYTVLTLTTESDERISNLYHKLLSLLE